MDAAPFCAERATVSVFCLEVVTLSDPVLGIRSSFQVPFWDFSQDPFSDPFASVLASVPGVVRIP